MNPPYTPRAAGLALLGTGVEEQEHHRGSASPASCQGAWRSLVGQAGTLGLEEPWGDAGRPLCSRDTSGEEELKKEKSVFVSFGEDCSPCTSCI